MKKAKLFFKHAFIYTLCFFSIVIEGSFASAHKNIDDSITGLILFILVSPMFLALYSPLYLLFIFIVRSVEEKIGKKWITYYAALTTLLIIICLFSTASKNDILYSFIFSIIPSFICYNLDKEIVITDS